MIKGMDQLSGMTCSSLHIFIKKLNVIRVTFKYDTLLIHSKFMHPEPSLLLPLVI